MVKQKGLSLRWRMILLVAGIPLAMLIPVLIFFAGRYTTAYRVAYWDKADIVATQIKYTLDDFIISPQRAKGVQALHGLFVDFVRASEHDGMRDFEFITLVDSNGQIVAHSTPELVNTVDKKFTNLVADAIYTSQNEEDPKDVFWVTQRQFPSGLLYLIIRSVTLTDNENAQLFVVVAENSSSADPPIAPLLVTAVLVIAVVIFLMQVFLNRIILTPLRKIAEGAAVIGAGDLQFRIDVQRKDELGFVADSFNNMSSQILDFVTSLETTVKTRTSALEKRNIQLEAASLVGQEAAQQRNVTELLEASVKTISDKFGFYHTAIFMLDDEKSWAILRAASSEGGLRMLNQGHRLRVGQEGMVGNVALTGKPRIAFDVGEDAFFFRNPHLQATRSEMALPLIFEDEVIGVLDVQSEDPIAFTTEDISVLQLMANQLAVALTNVRVLEVMQSTLVELRNLHADFARRGWVRITQSERPLAYEYDRTGTIPVAPIPVPLDLSRGKVEHQIVMDGETPVVIEALKSGERVLGFLGLSDENRVWTEDELSLVRSVGEQIALALDNARLFEDTQRNERQQLLISQMLQTASNPDLPTHLILPEIASILAKGLDYGIVIASLPVPDLPLVHPYAAMDPEGQPLVFFLEDALLDAELFRTYLNLQEPAFVKMQPFALRHPNDEKEKISETDAQFTMDQYDLDNVLFIPMIGGGVEKRFIILIREREKPSPNPETRELAGNLANQIAVVMDNLNLSEETRQRSEELRLLYQSSLYLSELLEPADVLKVIAEQGAQLLGADASNVWIYEPTSTDMVLSYDHKGDSEKRIGTRLRSGVGLVGQSLSQQKTLAINDYAIWENRIEGLISSRFHAVLAIPLIGRFGPLGVIVCLSEKPAVFGDSEISLADLFSAQAAAALENAQLNQQAQRRAEEFSRLYEAGIDLNTILDVEELLARAAEWAQRVLSAERAVLYIRQVESNTYLSGQSASSSAYYLDESADMETRDKLTDIIIKSKNSILIHDNRDYEILKSSALVEKGFLSLIGVPMQIGDDILGAMYVNSTELNHFIVRDINLLEFLATQVSSAIQTSIQFRQTERALAVVRRQARYQTNVSQSVALLTERGTESIQTVLQLLAEAADAPVALYYDAGEEGVIAYWYLHSFWYAPEITTELSDQPSESKFARIDVKKMSHLGQMLNEKTSIAISLHDLNDGERTYFQEYGCDMMMALAVHGAFTYPGFIILLRKGDMLWDNQEVVTLQTSAAALSNTIAREHLFNQVQHTLSETEALYRGSAALSEANSFQSILDVLLSHTVLGEGSSDVTLQLFNSMWTDAYVPDYAEVVALWSTMERDGTRERFYIKDFPSSIAIIRNGTPIFIEDVEQDPVLDRRARAVFNKGLGAASVVIVPLVVGGQRVGYINATYPERQFFSEQAKRQLTSLVQQAAIAVLNIQQLRATEARVTREQLIRQITSRIQESPDVEGVLQTAIRELGRAFSTSRNKIQFQVPKQETTEIESDSV